MTKRYVVKVEEVHVSHMLIEAEDEQGALEDWTSGDEIKLEYRRTVDDLAREVVEFNPEDYNSEDLEKMRFNYDIKV